MDNTTIEQRKPESAAVKFDRQKVTWEQAEKDCGWLGIVVNIHSFGQYDLVEYLPWKSKGSSISPKYGHHDKPRFAGYIDSERLGESWSSFDEAMIGLVCRKHDGSNSRAAPYIFDMLRMPREADSR